MRLLLGAALAHLAWPAAGLGPDTNFSQHPGFAEYFRQNPPAASPPGAAERALISRYRPRFYIPEGHPGPVDFYRDYIAHGVLFDAHGARISEAVTPEILNAHKNGARAEFRHREPAVTAKPVIYGRIDLAFAGASAPGNDSRSPLTFLTYHAVFRHSGLPAALKAWQSILAGIAGNPEDWHQLDHYTAVTVVLDAAPVPVAIMFQQHNYARTYLVGEGIEVPPDGRVRVDVAIRSNELYPHAPGRRTRRAVRFAEGEARLYLMGFGEQPLLAADDITDSRREVNYVLEYLPPDDAFYMFEGFLGERRALPGRSGPPGASYNTLPELKPLDIQLLTGYWREGHAGDRERYLAVRPRGPRGFAEAQREVFLHNLRCLSMRRAGCRLR